MKKKYENLFQLVIIFIKLRKEFEKKKLKLYEFFRPFFCIYEEKIFPKVFLIEIFQLLIFTFLEKLENLEIFVRKKKENLWKK